MGCVFILGLLYCVSAVSVQIFVCLLVWISICFTYCLEFLAKLLVEVRGLLQSGL